MSRLNAIGAGGGVKLNLIVIGRVTFRLRGPNNYEFDTFNITLSHPTPSSTKNVSPHSNLSQFVPSLIEIAPGVTELCYDIHTPFDLYIYRLNSMFYF